MQLLHIIVRIKNVRLEESPLILTEIESSSEYESEGETSIGSALSLYMPLPSTPLPPSTSLSPLLPPSYTISQHDLHAIIRQ